MLEFWAFEVAICANGTVIEPKSLAIGANGTVIEPKSTAIGAQTRAHQRPNRALSANHQAPMSHAVDADEVEA
jgi:hypothetical protein